MLIVGKHPSSELIAVDPQHSRVKFEHDLKPNSSNWHNHEQANENASAEEDIICASADEDVGNASSFRNESGEIIFLFFLCFDGVLHT